MAHQPGFQLPHQILRPKRLDQQRLCPLLCPVTLVRRIGGQQRGGGVVGLLAGFADHVETGILGLHASIGDDHLVDAGVQFLHRLGGGNGGVHLELLHLQDGFESQQDSNIVIDQQDSPLHKAPQPPARGRRREGPRLTRQLDYRESGAVASSEGALGLRYYRSVASFYVENFGCRATQADGAALERQFQERGLERAGAPAEAEIVVLNTCTVTAAADQDARAAIRRIHRQNPGCQIVVTGCYAQRAPEELAALPGVSQVIGNSHKHQLAEIAEIGPRASDVGLQSLGLDAPSSLGANGFVSLASLTSDARGPRSDARGPVFVSDIFAHTELLAAPVFDAANERTRPNLKVQDGCDNRCSFCVIPYVRGQSRSLNLEEVIREVDALVASGYREVVISGINLGRWGRDFSTPTRFADLVRAILEQSSLEKLRLSSVEPMDWSDELIRLVGECPRIAKHAHVPMQSGSDRVLRAMHRKYRPWHYQEKILKIRKAMPTAAIGADVMVGFPGETDADFEATRCLVEELPFTYLHVFTYSARPGTPAATMGKQVPVQVARERNRMLRELAAQKKLAFMRSFVGKTVDAITLNVFDGEYTEALTDNYLKLRLAEKHDANQWLRARVEQVTKGALVGRGAGVSPAPTPSPQSAML
jgi:threonylcarbamoyladenosine tRNA methylthiotransferase MtaB